MPTGIRDIVGKYAKPMDAAPPFRSLLRAGMASPNDKTTTTPRALKMDVAETCLPHECENEGEKDVLVKDIAVADAPLVRGRIAKARDMFRKEHPRTDDGVEPITVVPRDGEEGKYVVVRGKGEHRLAALKLAGLKNKPVKVMVARRKPVLALDTQGGTPSVRNIGEPSMNKADAEGEWITVSGAHILVKPGETKDQAVQRTIGKPGSSRRSGESFEESVNREQGRQVFSPQAIRDSKGKFVKAAKEANKISDETMKAALAIPVSDLDEKTSELVGASKGEFKSLASEAGKYTGKIDSYAHAKEAVKFLPAISAKISELGDRVRIGLARTAISTAKSAGEKFGSAAKSFAKSLIAVHSSIKGAMRNIVNEGGFKDTVRYLGKVEGDMDIESLAKAMVEDHKAMMDAMMAGEMDDAMRENVMDMVSDEEKDLGMKAKTEKEKDGKNPPSWVGDESLWEKAKKAVSKNYEESDAAYWPVVAHVYFQMGGEKLEKAAPPGHEFYGNQWGGGGIGGVSGSEGSRFSSRERGSSGKKDGGKKEKESEFKDVLIRQTDKEVVSGISKLSDYVNEDNSETADVGRDAFSKLKSAHESAKEGNKSRSLADLKDAFKIISDSRMPSVAKHGYLKRFNTVAVGIESLADMSDSKMNKADDDYGLSNEEIRAAIGEAVRMKWGKNYWVNTFYPETQKAIAVMSNFGDVVAYDGAMKCYLFDYEIDEETGEATIGEMVEVESKTSWEPVVKSANEVEYRGRRVGERSFAFKTLDGEAPLLAKRLNGAFDGAKIVGDERGVYVTLADGEDVVGDEMRVLAKVDGIDLRKFARRKDDDQVKTMSLDFIGDKEYLAKAAEKGVVYGIVYSPNEVDSQGEYAGADDIEKAAWDWMQKGGEFDVMHDFKKTADQVVESYIAPQDMKLGGKPVKKGSWVVAVKMCDDTKKLVKSGKYKGFSMGGMKQFVD